MGKMYVYKKMPIVAIQVEGYPEQVFVEYSMREAEKKYREKYGLKRVHLSKDFRRSHWEANPNGRKWIY